MLKISDRRFSVAIGVLAGLAVLFPLSGRIFGIQASIPAVLFLVGALGLLPFGRLRARVEPFAIVGLAAVFGLLVISAATFEQFQYFLKPGLWAAHADHYIESKLFMFVLYSAPPGLAAVMVALCPERHGATDGVLVAVSAMAAMAAIRTFSQPELIATDYMTARNWMVYYTGFSANSYAILLAIGAVAAMRWRHGWIATAAFLLACALMSRRAETALVIASMMVIAAWGGFWLKRRDLAIKAALAIVLAGTAFAFVHNGHNIRYFAAIERSAQERVDLLNEAAAISTASESIAVNNSHVTTKGLGSFASRLGNERKYPHNLIVEAYGEVGIAAAVLLAIIIFLPLSVGAYGAAMKRITYAEFLALGIFTIVTLISFKSGDLTSFGRVTFFCAVATPAVIVSMTLPSSWSSTQMLRD